MMLLVCASLCKSTCWFSSHIVFVFGPWGTKAGKFTGLFQVTQLTREARNSDAGGL